MPRVPCTQFRSSTLRGTHAGPMRQTRPNCLWTRRRGQGHVRRRGAGCRFGAGHNQPAGVPAAARAPARHARGHARGSEGALGNDAPSAALQTMQSGALRKQNAMPACVSVSVSVSVSVCLRPDFCALPCLSGCSCLRAHLLEQRRVVQLNHALSHGGAWQIF
jgi:hypothetical protein